MLNAKLVVVGGNTQFEQVDLKLPVVIGRGTDVDLAVTDELISRRHAEIVEQNGRLLVRDLGSRNGTFVNNRRIDSAANLEPDQLLTLGTITFRALYRVAENEDRNPVQSSETVRIKFSESETIHLPLTSGDPSQDDLETVDLDDFLLQRNSGNSRTSDDIAASQTVYGGHDTPLPRRAEAVSALDGRSESVPEHLRRRFPK